MRYTGIKTIDERIDEKIKAAEGRNYFVTRKLNECNELIPEVEKIIKDYKDALKPWRTTSWSAARDAAFRAARDAAYKAARDAAFNDAWHAAYKAARDAAYKAALYASFRGARDAPSYAGRNAALDAILNAVLYAAYRAAGDVASTAAKDVASYVAWEVIRDIKGHENNPFEKIIKLYDMGLYPRGFREVGRIEKFIVDCPLKTYELGCWAEGEKEILYKHRWREDCSKIRQVKRFVK
jgi:hypothetical protein